MSPAANSEDQWILVAKLSGAHGVTGEVKLVSFTAEPHAVFDYKDIRQGAGGQPLRLRMTKELKGSSFAIRLEGVKDRDAADLLRGLELFVHRDVLPDLDEDEYYLTDLIGLSVMDDETGAPLGTVRQVENHTGDDLLELHLDQTVKPFGRVVMLPFTKALVPVVDLAGRRITVRLGDWIADNLGDETE